MIKRQKQRMRLLLVAMALLALGAPAAAWSTDRKPAACEDHTPHKIRMVRVAPGVELEVLDWGGKGRAMVLLTGAGDNAHVYDEFAFQFTDYFHVYGITRRGFLPSSQPRHGYDVPTRAADDIAVLDALGIDKAVFVGHSLANSELSELGLRHRARVDKLVYLDATDLSGSSKLHPPPGASPLFTDAVFQSLWTYQAATARYFALREPDQSVCLNLEFDANGAITGSTSQQFITDTLFARCVGESARELGGNQGAAARHLCYIYPRGEAAPLLVSEPGRPGQVRRGMGADRRLPSRCHQQVQGGELGQHVPAARRSALCLHQQ